ncbi:hypothetical protein DTW90_30560 [Neorhizobium sp. P12A]|uniref:hypothetical protein n=1 Tax=Neorhizobium sp. P12A TaxID=2268027 RepID=UPI0011ECB541|nr:hypothetical protein [Neorhizobium sp. P12A]KAA0689837.1 hypothetical protein DTW90_30560 [Neorhizobium sp. P12A]
MPIITTKDGRNINSEHVAQYTTLRSGSVKFLLSTGGEYIAEPYAEDISEFFIPVIPANPGFVAVFAERWNDGRFYYRERSVIAWRLCPAGAYPVFEGYSGDGDDYAVIIDPAGGVFDSDHNLYSTLDDWKREYEAEANQRESASSDVALSKAA